ncbi:MAG: GNAT family N-acetyltransferase [Coriobacteriales bacterium]|nr:GNAT family N-acetyltransferase [Coriobacteriales bacterium]
MSEAELYKQLGALTKDRDRWEQSIPYVSSLLAHESVKIQAKALWLLGEMGLAFPAAVAVADAVSAIAAFLESPVPLLRERAINALGRIGRGNYRLVEPHWVGLFRFASDEEAKVRLSFIWASENIATNTPDVYAGYLRVFASLLHDKDDKVRMEAPEIFRVLGKRRPALVTPYVDELRRIAETDGNRVVRIHCLGALKAAGLLKQADLPIALTTAPPIAVVPMASEDEAKGKAYVHCMAWKEAYRGLIDQAFLDARTLEFSEERALRAFRSGVTTLLAKDGERVVGFADYGPCRDDDLPSAGEVYAIYLLSHYYGQGVGTKLMQAAFQAMAGCDTFVVWVLKGNERAIRFYRKLGFEFDGAAKTLNLGEEATDLRMVLYPNA